MIQFTRHREMMLQFTHLVLYGAVDQPVVAPLHDDPREARHDRLPHLVVHGAYVHREIHLVIGIDR